MFEIEEIVDQSEAPLKTASTNFESKRYVDMSADVLCVKPTFLSLAYSLVFVLLGISLVGLWGVRTFTDFQGPGSFPLALIGALFVFAGLGIYYSHNEYVLIERGVGVRFKRSWRLSNVVGSTNCYRKISSSEIDRIQLLSHVIKHRTSRNKRRSTYTEFQVNLCLTAGDRFNLFVTLKSANAEKCAVQASSLLDVPLQRL